MEAKEREENRISTLDDSTQGFGQLARQVSMSNSRQFLLGRQDIHTAQNSGQKKKHANATTTTTAELLLRSNVYL